MTKTPSHCLAFSMALWTVCASAQQLAPMRYQTAEGVEVIVGRDAAAATKTPLAATASLASPPSSATALAPRGVSAIAGSTAVSNPVNFRSGDAARSIPADEQRRRDKESVNILTQEIVNEGRALQLNRQALGSPRAGVDLTTDQLAGLRASVARHEANLRALDNELRRAHLQINAKGLDGQDRLDKPRSTSDLQLR
jgi:hypothetical protein